MEQLERLIIYPFDIESCPIVRHEKKLPNKKIVGLVSPKGWGLDGRNIDMIDGGVGGTLSVSSNFESILNACDAVLFAPSHNKIDFNKNIYPKIVKSIETGKKIICTIPLEPSIKSKIDEICKSNSVHFEYYGDNRKVMIQEEIKRLTDERLMNINTAIVFVLGVGERTNKFQIQLDLAEGLESMGYKVSLISSRVGSELLGYYSFPAFMKDNNLNECQKVVAFNRYVKSIEDKDNPDLIIVGIPGGTMALNEYFTAGFGITAYEVSNAVTPDFSIVSLLFEDFKEEYFETMYNSIRYKLGFDVDCFNISNSKLEWMISKAEQNLQYNVLDSVFIDKKKEQYKNMPAPIYNIFSDKDKSKMTDYLVSKLCDYANIN